MYQVLEPSADHPAGRSAALRRLLRGAVLHHVFHLVCAPHIHVIAAIYNQFSCMCMYVGWTSTTTCSASFCWCTLSWRSPVRKSPLCCATSSSAVRLGQRAVHSQSVLLP